MTGSDYNFGPPWFWNLLAFLAIVGIVAILGSAAFGVVWLIQHLEFKP